MSFKLSPKVNPPTVFLARWSELTDRFDPAMVLFRRKLHSYKYPVKPLRKLFSEPPQYGAGERGIERISMDQPRYVRITDIDEFGILSNELGVTAEIVDSRYLLKEDDLLIARSGNTVGKSYIHKKRHASYSCFYAGYLIRFRFNDSIVTPDYVFAITQLPYYKKWVEAIKRPAGQPNINAQEYSSLQIPVPDRAVQDKVVKRLNDAYEVKRIKENDAAELLEGIDVILIKELGIKLPPEPSNTIKNRIFKRRISQVAGKRLDPLYHQKDAFEFVRKTKHPITNLGDNVQYFQTGFAAGRNDQGEEETGIIQIRPTNLSNERELIFGRNIYISSKEIEKRRMDVLKRGEVLFNNTNSQELVGKTVYFDVEGDYFCSNHITRIQTKKGLLDPQYLCHILNLYQRKKAFFKTCINWNNQSGVGVDILRTMPIPLPSPTRQKNIVERIEQVRDDAKELKRKAVAELEKAKKEIENMILTNKGKS